MLKGEFIGLRSIERQDLSQLLDWRNKPEYRQYFREYRELGMDNQISWYEKKILQDSGTRMFAVIDLTTCKLIGACGLCYIDWINRSADLSIYIGENELYIDKKFAPDTCRVLIAYAFDGLGLHRLWSEIYEFDESKKRLFDTLGFQLDGIHRETHWFKGKWYDSLFYGYLSTDYYGGKKLY